MIRDDIVSSLYVLILVLVPVIPGAILWLLLDPVTFWQRFAVMTVAGIAYLLVFIAEVEVA